MNMFSHLVSKCSELAQKEYKKLRHDKVTALLHCQWWKTYGFRSYGFMDYGVRILWEFSIQTETKIDNNKSDIVLLEKKDSICYIVDVACSIDPRIEKKEKDKLKGYTDLKYGIINMWKNEVIKGYIVPVVIGALGVVKKHKQISGDNWVQRTRKTAENMFVGNT